MTTTKQKGFTLVELMIVVAIIGVLAAITIPKFKQKLAESRAKAALEKGNAAREARNSSPETHADEASGLRASEIVIVGHGFGSNTYFAYLYDPRTEMCFAETSEGLTKVPCTEDVLKLTGGDISKAVSVATPVPTPTPNPYSY